MKYGAKMMQGNLDISMIAKIKVATLIYVVALSLIMNFICGCESDSKYPTSHELKSKSDDMVKNDITNLNLAVGLNTTNDEWYTISNFKITKIYKKGNITFAFLDMNSRAPEGFVYWYNHKRLSEEFGFEIKGLKYQ